MACFDLQQAYQTKNGAGDVLSILSNFNEFKKKMSLLGVTGDDSFSHQNPISTHKKLVAILSLFPRQMFWRATIHLGL